VRETASPRVRTAGRRGAPVPGAFGSPARPCQPDDVRFEWAGPSRPRRAEGGYGSRSGSRGEDRVPAVS
jgi:hypothetical protein